jgi:CheY-like chemotaxis protein
MTHENAIARIVLVSRDPDWRSILGTLLRHAGFFVSEVEDADRVEDHAPGAALVVTNFPVLRSDGRTVTECLRAAPQTASIPILSATTHVTSDELAAAYRAGVDRTVILPTSLSALAGVVIEMAARSPVRVAFSRTGGSRRMEER